MYIYTNLNEITFSLFFIHTTFQIAFIGLFKKYLFESDYRVTQLFVGLPPADFGQNLREKQAKPGDLKPSAQRYFLIF